MFFDNVWGVSAPMIYKKTMLDRSLNVQIFGQFIPICHNNQVAWPMARPFGSGPSSSPNSMVCGSVAPLPNSQTTELRVDQDPISN